MKFIKLSVGFLIASLLQGIIVFIGEKMGVSQFDIQFTVIRVIHHILVGQASGYVLFWLITHIDRLKNISALLSGSLFGVLTWMILIFVGSHTGLIQQDWLQFGGVATTLFAFIVYGFISGLTITNWRRQYG